MSEQATGRSKRSGIDIPKTIAGVLAAVSAAVVGSFLGVAGTLVGAAVASIVGSVGTELYHRGIDRSSKKLRQTFVTAPAAVGTPEVAAAAEETPSQPEPESSAKMRWGRIAAVAGAVFVLAMGALTTFELISHESVANAVGNKSAQGSTVGSLFSSNKKSTPTPSPSESSSVAPTESASPSPSSEPSTAATTTSPEPTSTDTQTQTTTTDPSPADTQTQNNDVQPQQSAQP